jgi:hypothetical protein
MMRAKCLAVAFVCVLTLAAVAKSQGTGATIQGLVTDPKREAIPGASVTAVNTETNIQRTAITGEAGIYVIPDLPPGRYHVQVFLPGFKTSVHENIDLVVGQQLTLNTVLEAGQITEEKTVTSELSRVDISTAQVAGVVGEREVKDLPLNGRSFDDLITLNPATVNATAVKGEASGSSGPGNNFAIAGQRPGHNIFLWNGVEYPGGSSAESSTPGGVSGQLLGIDAVREFNVVTSIDSAEAGHRVGGQVSVVTKSGTNSFHGTVFEFLRNSALDARNFFDQDTIPPLKRNQFGGSAGGPIRKDGTFIFGNYEGFRQRLGLSRVAIVPDAEARQGFLPCNIVSPTPNPCPPSGRVNVNLAPGVAPYFNLWPAPDGGELLQNGLPTGTARAFSNPNNPIREDFGIARLDHSFSNRDSLGGAYTIDDGDSTTPGQNPFSLSVLRQRTQILTLSELHVISPSVVNDFTAGLSRVHYGVSLPVSIQPSGVEPFVKGLPIGQIKIGGGAAGGAVALSVAGSGPGNGSNQTEITNLYTYEDQLQISRGIHSLKTGVWFERLQNTEFNINWGQAIFPSLQTFLQGKPSQLSIQLNQGVLPWRSWLGAWFVQDSIKVRPNLTLSVGLRHEFSNGYHNKFHNASNLVPGPDGVLLTDPAIGDSLFAKNTQKWLFGPRAGVAWDPFGKGRTSIRLGAGMAYNLLDNIGACCRTVNPLYSTYVITPSPFPYQQDPAAPFPAGLPVTKGGTQGGGIQPDAQPATTVHYRFEIEQRFGAMTSLRLAYSGSHGYHDIMRADSNTVIPAICSGAAANCPAGLADGTKYFPAGALRPNPQLSSIVQYFTSAVNRYNAASIDLNRRLRVGLAFRTNYTFSKSMDNASSLTAQQAIGNPPLVLDPHDRMRDYGLSAFDVRHRFSFSGSYELPFGNGKRFLKDARGIVNQAVSGWQFNIINNLRSGFPFTPALGFNWSRDGNTSTPDRVSFAPGRTLNGIYLRRPEQWVDATAFVLPPAGTYGNAGRNILIGPGSAMVDVSAFKTTRLTEGRNLQLRAEIFNVLNHANFGIPSPIMLTSTGATAAAAGVITSTSTTSRQIQLGAKLNF